MYTINGQWLHKWPQIMDNDHNKWTMNTINGQLTTVNGQLTLINGQLTQLMENEHK